MHRLLLLLPLLLAPACDSELSILSARCDVDVSSLSPREALPGETVTITGTPLTTDFDTVVSFGSAKGTVLEVDRSSCTACDSCRATQGCTTCEDCDNCDTICREECVETITVTVPEVPAGEAGVRVINSHGTSALLSFTVLPGSTGDDTGGSDGGGGDDTGTSDTGSSDTGSSDTGSSDGGAGEGGGDGSTDTGTADPPAPTKRARPTASSGPSRLGTCPGA